MQIAELAQVEQLVKDGALFIVNHSGGKDSQVMYDLVSRVVPAEQIAVVHAVLPGMEWRGTMEQIQGTVTQPVYVCQAVKTFEQMTRGRGYFPAPKYRQCTSDLKRGPLEKLIRQILKERGLKLVVNCEGLRAQESQDRAKRPLLELDKRNSKAGRTWYKYNPIHALLINDVWAVGNSSVADLERRRQLYRQGNRKQALDGWAFHWAYVAGMSRLSCVICIFMGNEDKKVSAQENPQTWKDFAQVERDLDQTFFMPKKGKEREFITDLVIL